MPLFDYRCADCRKRFSLLLGVVAEPQEEKCPACGSTNVSRLISRFARLRSEDDLIEDLADPSKIGDLEDPKELAGWMKRMGKEMGEDVGDDFDEILEEADAGEDSLE
jgi:putative FmdB family regulatory protein